MRPGLFAGGTIVFIWAFTDIGTPLILGYEHLVPVTIFKDLATSRHQPAAVYSLVFVHAHRLGGAVRAGQVPLRARRRGRHRPRPPSPPRRRKLGAAGTLGAWLLFGAVIVLAVLPHVGVVLTAVADGGSTPSCPASYTLEHLTLRRSRSPDTYRSILNSLAVRGRLHGDRPGAGLPGGLADRPHAACAGGRCWTAWPCCRWRCRG